MATQLFLKDTGLENKVSVPHSLRKPSLNSIGLGRETHLVGRSQGEAEEAAEGLGQAGEKRKMLSDAYTPATCTTAH